MIFHTVLTSSYEVMDKRRFKFGTLAPVADVEDYMRRCWTLEPISSRVGEDVLMIFERVLRRIVEAKCEQWASRKRTGMRSTRARRSLA